jgi:hypothetical protein
MLKNCSIKSLFGLPSGTSDRLVIKTKTETYILFTNVATVKKKLFSIAFNKVFF